MAAGSCGIVCGLQAWWGQILHERMLHIMIVALFKRFSHEVRKLCVRAKPDPGFLVVGTALAAKADLLVTGDRLLLSVVEYQCVRIVGVTEALQMLAAEEGR